MSTRKRNPGWVPRQHGAWAMLVVPYVAGVVAVFRHGEPTARWGAAAATMFCAWMLGYFAFAAASLWLKARPARRPALRTPVLVYPGAAAVAGLATLAIEPRLAWWAPAYAVLTGVTLVLVHLGDERSVASGLLTTVAAGLMAATVQAPTPAAATADQWTLAAVCAAYFFGTVLYVKTLIRERGKPVWVWLSIGYHVVAAAVSIAVGSTLLTCFFVLAAARAAAVPLAGPMRGRRVIPKQAGIGELVLSVLLLLVLATL